MRDTKTTMRNDDEHLIPIKKAKPCPFCGGKRLTIFRWSPSEYWVLCLRQSCDTAGPKRKTPTGAVGAWDRRA